LIGSKLNQLAANIEIHGAQSAGAKGTALEKKNPKKLRNPKLFYDQTNRFPFPNKSSSFIQFHPVSSTIHPQFTTPSRPLGGARPGQNTDDAVSAPFDRFLVASYQL